MTTILKKGKHQAIDQALSWSIAENQKFTGQPAVQFSIKETNPPLTEAKNFVLASGAAS
jgi:hypothetical protein